MFRDDTARNLPDSLRRTITSYDSIAQTYAEKWFEASVMEFRIREFVTTLADNGSILDAGCGPGRDTQLMMRLGMEVVGVDLSRQMVNEATRRVPNGTFRWMDMRLLRFPPSTFQGVWCCAALHHLSRLDAVNCLHEFHRVLIKGGNLAVSVQEGHGEDFDSLGRYRTFYESSEFRSILGDAGFEIIAAPNASIQDGTSIGSNSKTWLYFLARKSGRIEESVVDIDDGCPLCPANRFKYLHEAGLSSAGSILIGNQQLYLALDGAPMTEGHLLLVSSSHQMSFGDTHPRIDSTIIEYQKTVCRLFETTYGRKPLFFEHGPAQPGEAGACVDHAHWHCIPLDSVGIKRKVEERFGTGIPASLETLRRMRHVGQSYLYWGVGTDGGTAYSVDVVPSQFFRQVLSVILRDDNWRWRSAMKTEKSRTRHEAIRRMLLPHVDEMLMKPAANQ